MNRTTLARTVSIITAAVTGLALTGCSAKQDSYSETFAFSGETLNVTNKNSNMGVSVSVYQGPVNPGEEVTVTVNTQTRGQSAKTPGWSLSDDVLNLDSPCGGGWLGYCEGSYSLDVPDGVRVLVNGEPTAAN